MKHFDDNMENRADRENTGKVSKVVKNILAAGLAVGGAAAFGDMDVFAAENEEGNAEVSVEMPSESDAGQSSAEIQTEAVSVETSEPVASEPAVSEPVAQDNGDSSQTTTQSSTQTTTTYYVDSSTISNYENVNENPGEDRTHLYDQETTTTTTTTTTETSSQEAVDVSGRKNDPVEDVARDVAGDTDKDGQYTTGEPTTSTSEDGSATTVTETGAVTDTESTFEGNTTTTTTTTAEVTKTTTTETKKDFASEAAAESWSKEDGYTNGSVTEGDSVTTETEKRTIQQHRMRWMPQKRRQKSRG